MNVLNGEQTHEHAKNELIISRRSAQLIQKSSSFAAQCHPFGSRSRFRSFRHTFNLSGDKQASCEHRLGLFIHSACSISIYSLAFLFPHLSFEFFHQFCINLPSEFIWFCFCFCSFGTMWWFLVATAFAYVAFVLISFLMPMNRNVLQTVVNHQIVEYLLSIWHHFLCWQLLFLPAVFFFFFAQTRIAFMLCRHITIFC